ncbi:MAG: MBL fold metallo-hydrolase [Bacilli bacterium]|nr:MBL fold metallo-hydrolase [Bacilli bacterium]
MMALFALLGATLGLYLGYWSSVARTIITLMLTLLVALWARHRKALKFFLPFLSFAFAIAIVLRFLPETPGKVEVVGMVVRASDNYLLLQVGIRRYYVYLKGHSYEVGDFLRLSGKKVVFITANYESRFDFAEYLKSHGVFYSIETYQEPSTVFGMPFRFRAYQNRFLSHFDSHARSYLSALLFGRKDYESDFVSKADAMNLLFILSSSGMLYGWLLRTFHYFIDLKWEKQADIATLVFGLIFLPLSLGKIGIARVYLMRLIGFLSKRRKKGELEYLDRVGISGLVLLALDFHNAFQSGFLLGYGISLTLFFATNLIAHPKKIVTRARGLVLLRLFVLPVSLLSGQGLHLFGMVFTLLLTPLSILTTCLGYFSFFTFPLPWLLNPLGNFAYTLLQVLEAIDFTLPLPIPSVYAVVFYYAIYFVSMFLTELGATSLRAKIWIGVATVYVLSLVPFAPMVTSSVRFINVGQGDCCLIQDGMTNVMIDTGGIIGFDMAEESLIPYLRKNRIYHLDAIIASHQDYDHVGAVASLMEHFRVERYVTERSDFPLHIGNLRFENYNVYDASEENDKSLVLGLDFMKKRWIFTGDAPIWIEKAIIQDHPELDCDILKVGHHGSDTSTCAEWLDTITPQTAVISCGVKNKFGHPKPSVLSLLQQRGIEVRRTDLEGTIVFSSLRFASLM